jgi:predicted aminopeptidase
LLSATRTRLRDLYASGLAPDAMRAAKEAEFSALRASYAALQGQWGGHAPFDVWFAGNLNNAHLASIATYYSCVPGFQRELAAVGGDLPAFYRRVRELAKMPQTERDALVCGTS